MAPAYSKDLLLSMYRKMYLIRRFEERAAQAYTQGKINGFCHLYIGQEAVAVGATEALRPDDYQLGAYRDHGYPLTRGADPGMVMAELFGKRHRLLQGQGRLDAHLRRRAPLLRRLRHRRRADPARRRAWPSPRRYRSEDRVTVCYFGDAAANQGAFHETLNMAAKWKLPVIFLCENNRYGMGTAFARVSPMPEVYKRAAAYDMRGEPVDGMDVPQGLRGGEGLRRALPRRQGPGAARGQHLPLPRPLDVRPGHLPHQGRGGAGAEGTTPSRSSASGAVEQTKLPRVRVRGHRRRGEGDDRRGGEVRRRVARARRWTSCTRTSSSSQGSRT